MTIQQAQYVLEIARLGSISKAAAALFLSQPALSAQLSALEQELECPLFTRSPRGVELTEAGRRFCQYAAPAVEAWHTLRARCAELRDSAFDSLRIGFDVRAQSNGLMKPVLDYCDGHRMMNVSFITDMYQNALEALEEREMDLAVCRLPPAPMMPRHERLHIQPLLTERQCILMAPATASVCPPELPFSFLAGKPVVCGPKNSVDDVEMEIVCAKYHFKVSRILRADDIGTVMTMVRNGRGFALGPASLAERFAVAAVPLLPCTQIDLNFICRKEEKDREPIKGLAELLLKAAGGLGSKETALQNPGTEEGDER